ncbi:MAG: SRPBCC family protein [Gemmatimonadales bacterium]
MDGARVTQSRSTFSLRCRVEIHVKATPDEVWDLLVEAPEYHRWNSTVTRIDGQIREGERLTLHVPGTDRSFRPRVSDLIPNERMTWTGGLAPVFKGARTFLLRAGPDCTTDFIMEERFTGILLPLVGRSMPDFRPIFERFAQDLKRAAEQPVEAGG